MIRRRCAARERKVQTLFVHGLAAPLMNDTINLKTDGRYEVSTSRLSADHFNPISRARLTAGIQAVD